MMETNNTPAPPLPDEDVPKWYCDSDRWDVGSMISGWMSERAARHAAEARVKELEQHIGQDGVDLLRKINGLQEAKLEAESLTRAAEERCEAERQRAERNWQGWMRAENEILPERLKAAEARAEKAE